MADKDAPKRAVKKAAKKRAKKEAPGKGNLRNRAFGNAADAFGKEIVPLGPRAGALTTRVGNHLLTMLEGSVYGLEKVGEWLKNRVSSKLEDVPVEDVVKPSPRIAIPAVQSLIYSMDEEHIREMFANLLAADMNRKAKSRAHPAFVELIKQMTSHEARILEEFRSQQHLRLIAELRKERGSTIVAFNFSLQVPGVDGHEMDRALSNLDRLGLIERTYGRWPVLADLEGREKEFLEHCERAGYNTPEFRKETAALPGVPIRGGEEGLLVTPLGRLFIAVCLPRKGEKAGAVQPTAPEPDVRAVPEEAEAGPDPVSQARAKP